MKNILRAIGGGLAIGGALFLAPFLGRIILFVLLLRLAFRLLGGRRNRWGRGRGQGVAAFFGAPVPIDNQWYRPAIVAGGPASSVPVA